MPMFTKTPLVLGTALLGCSLAVASAARRTTPPTDVPQKATKTPARNEPHRVLGNVPFSYSYPETLARARSNGKPILAYFTFDT